MSKACVLLLKVKKYLRELHALSDVKIRDYSPSDPAKQWERPLTVRRSVQAFNPTTCVQKELELSAAGLEPDYKFLVGEYFSFRQVMMTIDPNEEDEDEIAAGSSNANAAQPPGPGAGPAPPGAAPGAVPGEGEGNPADYQNAMERALKLRISLTRCDQANYALPCQIEPINEVQNVESDDSVGSAPDQNFVSGTRQRHQRSSSHRTHAGRHRFGSRSGGAGGGNARHRVSSRTHAAARSSRSAKRTSKRRRLQYSSSSDDSDDDSFDEDGSDVHQITDDESEEDDW